MKSWQARKRSMSAAVFCLPGVVIGAALSGCQSPSQMGSAGASPVVASAPSQQLPAPPTGTTTPNPVPTANPLVGETCTGGDVNKLCLAMHFVAYKDAGGSAVVTTNQAATIIHKMNTLWAQCDIGFQIEKYEAVDPTTSGLVYGAASQNQLDQIRGAYDSPTDELLAVTTGPWGTTVNAWTNLPGDGIYGSVMEASIVTYGDGIIYAHEFGHYLGLAHVSDTSNLMNPVIYTTSTALTSSQCQAAVQTANSYWSAMLRK